ncbi:MAG: zf-HC2 domain-containing protein [Acidimicrobiia bacterium]|nr:zf-HC2 domain-containing protein [Acidimicrobiia bacterium]
MSGPAHGFDETMISGYLDGELTQGDTQRVRLHLEGCDGCRRLADDLRKLSDATMATDFRTPSDTQWDETPRTSASRLFHTSSWILGMIWVIGLVGFVVYQIATDGESTRFDGLIPLGLVATFGLAVLSALIDRVQTRKTDPYRKVKK